MVDWGEATMDPVIRVPVLFLEQEMERGQLFELAGGQAMVFSRGKPGRSGPNEDAAALLPAPGDAQVLAVADGLGGAPAGARASATAVRALHAALLEHGARAGGELRDAILNGFERANAELTALGLGAATTMAAVAVDQDTVRTVHVGDCAVLVVGQRGAIKLQTVSHSPVSYAVEAGMLDEQEAMHHAERHFVNNTVGSSAMRIEVGPPLALAARDTLVLGSDGLFDNFYPDEIVERIRRGPLERVAERLVRCGLERMQAPGGADELPSKADDLTFILYRRAGRR